MPKYKFEDIEKYRLELQYEKAKAKAFKQSIVEWRLVNAQLERQAAGAALEPSEWKTRCESQVSYNHELEQQVANLARRVQEERQYVRDPQARKDDPRMTTETDVKKLVKNLTREKHSLESQLRDCNWRLDDEAKAFHRADEKRRMLLMDAARARQTIMTEHEKKDTQALQRALANLDREYRSGRRGSRSLTGSGSSGRSEAPSRFQARRSSKGYATMNATRRRGTLGELNIRANHRILEPDKGPISKIAAVKMLPKLEDRTPAQDFKGTV